MKQSTIVALSRLASSAYQERYIEHATKEEYVLPEELVDIVITQVQGELKTNPRFATFTAQRCLLAFGIADWDQIAFTH